eukprot:2383583-Amphidinium_carterae.1
MGCVSNVMRKRWQDQRHILVLCNIMNVLILQHGFQAEEKAGSRWAACTNDSKVALPRVYLIVASCSFPESAKGHKYATHKNPNRTNPILRSGTPNVRRGVGVCIFSNCQTNAVVEWSPRPVSGLVVPSVIMDPLLIVAKQKPWMLLLGQPKEPAPQPCNSKTPQASPARCRLANSYAKKHRRVWSILPVPKLLKPHCSMRLRVRLWPSRIPGLQWTTRARAYKIQHILRFAKLGAQVRHHSCGAAYDKWHARCDMPQAIT